VAKIISTWRSIMVILPFERKDLERHQVGMDPRPIKLEPITGELLTPGCQVVLLGLVVNSSIGSDLLLNIVINGKPRTNGHVSAALIEKARNPIQWDYDIPVFVTAQALKDLVVDCGFVAQFKYPL